MVSRLTELRNGLRVISEDQPHLETTAVGLWVDAGSRNESKFSNGVAHLIEHMAFKGTQTRNAVDIAEEIEAVGGHLNAYTSREHTAYFARVLREDLPLAVDIIADILQNSIFDSDELAREQEVVVQEIGQAKDTPDDMIFDHFQAAAYPDQPIGRSILGEVENVRCFSRSDLFTYMNSQYQAQRMVVSASGRVDHDLLTELVGEKLGEYPSSNPPELVPASYCGGNYREDSKLEQVHLVIGFPGLSYQDADYFAGQVLSVLLGGGMSSRLFQEIREKLGLCYAISAFSSSYIDSGLFGVYAGTGESQIGKLVPAIVNQVVDATESINEDEIQRSKAQLKAGLMMSLESPSARCEQLARQLLIYDRSIPTSELIAEVEKVDGKQLNNLANRLIESGNPVVAAMGPLSQLENYETTVSRLSLK